MKYKTKEERLQELNVFVRVNNRLPSAYSKDPTEKSLGNWIVIRNKKKYPEIQEIYDKYRYRKKSKERIQELKEFIEVNNRLPSAYSKGSTEKSLEYWMIQYGRKYPEVQEIYDKYRNYKTPKERIQKLKEFVKVNNRLPSRYSKDPIEKSLGRWMHIYKNKYPEIQEIWGNYRNQKTKEERFLEFKEWVIKNNKLPSQKSKNPIEKSLGKWKGNNRNWDILKQFIAIFKFKEEYPSLWELEISEA